MSCENHCEKYPESAFSDILVFKTGSWSAIKTLTRMSSREEDELPPLFSPTPVYYTIWSKLVTPTTLSAEPINKEMVEQNEQN